MSERLKEVSLQNQIAHEWNFGKSGWQRPGLKWIQVVFIYLLSCELILEYCVKEIARTKVASL